MGPAKKASAAAKKKNKGGKGSKLASKAGKGSKVASRAGKKGSKAAAKKAVAKKDVKSMIQSILRSDASEPLSQGTMSIGSSELERMLEELDDDDLEDLEGSGASEEGVGSSAADGSSAFDENALEYRTEEIVSITRTNIEENGQQKHQINVEVRRAGFATELDLRLRLNNIARPIVGTFDEEVGKHVKALGQLQRQEPKKVKELQKLIQDEVQTMKGALMNINDKPFDATIVNDFAEMKQQIDNLGVEFEARVKGKQAEDLWKKLRTSLMQGINYAVYERFKLPEMKRTNFNQTRNEEIKFNLPPAWDNLFFDKDNPTKGSMSFEFLKKKCSPMSRALTVWWRSEWWMSIAPEYLVSLSHLRDSFAKDSPIDRSKPFDHPATRIKGSDYANWVNSSRKTSPKVLGYCLKDTLERLKLSKTNQKMTLSRIVDMTYNDLFGYFVNRSALVTGDGDAGQAEDDEPDSSGFISVPGSLTKPKMDPFNLDWSQIDQQINNNMTQNRMEFVIELGSYLDGMRKQIEFFRATHQSEKPHAWDPITLSDWVRDAKTQYMKFENKTSDADLTAKDWECINGLTQLKDTLKPLSKESECADTPEDHVFGKIALRSYALFTIMQRILSKRYQGTTIRYFPGYNLRAVSPIFGFKSTPHAFVRIRFKNPPKIQFMPIELIAYKSHEYDTSKLTGNDEMYFCAKIVVNTFWQRHIDLSRGAFNDQQSDYLPCPEGMLLMYDRDNMTVRVKFFDLASPNELALIHDVLDERLRRLPVNIIKDPNNFDKLAKEDAK